MSELALQRIRENIKKHKRGEDARRLDLGKCGMTEMPEELLECVWLEELILENNRTELYGGNSETNNRLTQNYLTKLPPWLAELSKLRILNLRGDAPDDWPISDLSPISGLLNLQKLFFSNTKVSDLSPISRLSICNILSCYLHAGQRFVADFWTH